MISHRSKVVMAQQCPRMRYYLGEYEGSGLSPAEPSIFLATGGAVHKGLAEILNAYQQTGFREYTPRFEDSAAQAAFEEFGIRTESIANFSNTSVWTEQINLSENLVRLAARTIVPKLLETYEILEIEHSGMVTLENPNGEDIEFHFTPDALLRDRASGRLFVLSWKTASFLPREEETRVDLQGITETWGEQSRANYAAGVQMAYLIKGPRVKFGDSKRQDSSLVWGWRSVESGELVPSYHWTCNAPHRYGRKTKNFPEGILQCEGNGRKHERPGEWELAPVWNEYISLREWMDKIPEDILNKLWVLPAPIIRRPSHIDSYIRQMRSQEFRIADALSRIKLIDEAIGSETDPEISGYLENAKAEILDEDFPQNGTAFGCKLFGSPCPAREICFGPSHISADPIGSGLYTKRDSLYGDLQGVENES